LSKIYEQLREQIGALAPEGHDLQRLRDQALAALDEYPLDDAQSLLIRLAHAMPGRTAVPKQNLTAAGL
jgi:hypothetical protein